jgi:putative addiction module component (TIGR02574 family)
MPSILPVEVAGLSSVEKLQLVEDIWDALVVSGVDFPLSTDQKKILRAERKAIRANPAEGSSWPEVKVRILSGK